MNTVHTFSKPDRKKLKISKRDLHQRIKLLEDIVQELIEEKGKAEGLQIGVMNVSVTDGVKFVLYRNPLLNCADCNVILPLQREGEESWYNDNGELICESCDSKKKSK